MSKGKNHLTLPQTSCSGVRELLSLLGLDYSYKVNRAFNVLVGSSKVERTE